LASAEASAEAKEEAEAAAMAAAASAVRTQSNIESNNNMLCLHDAISRMEAGGATLTTLLFICRRSGRGGAIHTDSIRCCHASASLIAMETST